MHWVGKQSIFVLSFLFCNYVLGCPSFILVIVALYERVLWLAFRSVFASNVWKLPFIYRISLFKDYYRKPLISSTRIIFNMVVTLQLLPGIIFISRHFEDAWILKYVLLM